MSRYRKTMREALEEVYASDFNEGKMKDIYTMQQSGATTREIADKMKLPLKVVKDILGEDSINEKFTKKDFDRNEDENEHTKNSYELAKMFGDTSEKSRMTRLYNKTRKVGSFLTKAENDFVTMIQSKYYRRLREELELDEQIKTFNRNALTPLEKSELAKHFDKIANTGTTTEKPYYQTLSRYVMGNVKPFEFNDMIGGAPTHVLGSINRNVMKIIGKAKAKSFIPGFKEEVELDELQNYSRQLKDPSKEMLVVDKEGKVSVIDKSEFEKYKRQGYMAAEDIEEDGPCWKTHKQVGMKKKNGRMVPNCVPKNEELDESVKVEGGPPTDGGPGSGAHNHDKKSSSRFDKVSNVKSFGKNLKGVTGVRQNGNRLEFDSNDGTATAREILKKFGKGKVKVTSMPDDEDEEGMKATVVVTPVKEELDTDDTSLVKKVANMLKKASKKHASQSKMLDKAVNEADLTDKQVKMVRKVADKLPKDDFKKRYGKDADNVKFGTATNIVKKKLNIDGYEGARNLVDRLLKQERGDE